MQAAGFICAVCGVMLCIMAFLGYRVDAGLMDESAMPPFAFLFVAVVCASVAAAIRFMNTKAKK